MSHPYRPAPVATTNWMPAWLEHIVWWWYQPSSFWGRFWCIGFAICVFVIFAQGCTDPARQIQAQTANAVAQGANAALPILVERYRQAGFRAVDKLKASGGTAEDVPATLAAVKAKWKPVWAAWEVLRVAQDGWADTLEGGGDPSAALSALKDAYCGLRGVWPDDIPAVPLAPIKCAEKPAARSPEKPAPESAAGT